MTTHLGVMIVFAACVSAVFGVLMRETTAEQIRFGVRLFVALTAGAYALGWLMYLVFH